MYPPAPALLLLLPALAASQGLVTNYAPQTSVQCPDITSTTFVRQFTPQNQTLNTNEAEYVDIRANTVVADAWAAWLGAPNSYHGYNISAFQGNFPKIGMAISGGGLRAALFGAGALNALDARNDTAKAAGTGGLLQVTSYLSGLSGGSWLTGSMYFNNWPTILDMVLGDSEQGSDGWLLDLDLALPDGDNIFSDSNQKFYSSILSSVTAKAQKGIDTSITDPWARMISYHFLNGTTRKNFFLNDSAHGAGLLWSNLPLVPAFQQHQTPFPIIVVDSRPAGSNLTTPPSLNSTIYEITPMEFASYDPSLSAGFNLSYAGTQLTNGEPANSSACVHGFDQAGFIMGTSASLFNQLFDYANDTFGQFSLLDSKALAWVQQHQLQQVRTRDDDVANWPNPFTGVMNTSFQDANSTWLELIAGGSNSANVPYDPLFVKARALDVIVTIEGSADIMSLNWPNGSSPITTSTRLSTLLNSSHQQFPPIPTTPKDFIETGVNARATFFGCDPGQTPPEYPLVIYLPNAPPNNGVDPVTNTGSFQLAYTPKHQFLFLTQAFDNIVQGFTPNSPDPDANFGTCLQCAAIDRARLKVSPPIPRSDACNYCFQQYCFDPVNPPTKNDLPPGRKLLFVDPDPQGAENFATKNKFALVGGLAGLVVLLVGLIGALLLWRKRRNVKLQAYQRVGALHDELDQSPWQKFVQHPGSEYHELPFRED